MDSQLLKIRKSDFFLKKSSSNKPAYIKRIPVHEFFTRLSVVEELIEEKNSRLNPIQFFLHLSLIVGLFVWFLIMTPEFGKQQR